MEEARPYRTSARGNSVVFERSGDAQVDPLAAAKVLLPHQKVCDSATREA